MMNRKKYKALQKEREVRRICVTYLQLMIDRNQQVSLAYLVLKLEPDNIINQKRYQASKNNLRCAILFFHNTVPLCSPYQTIV
jgi:hypothetical protein